jgi:GTPase
MVFVDEVTVSARAGRGGNGSAHLHSEPYKPRGGPDGGDGGDGGSVVFEVQRGVHDLSWLADHPHLRAGDGVAGRSTRRDGAAGKDLVIAVPDGTVVFDADDLIADLVGEGSRAVVSRGGQGGRGNVAFAGPRNRVPRTAEPGEAGEERSLRVELRTVAEVGLVGLPNAGKSTLLSRLTAAKPKIAAYPFTTLTPNLGVAGDGSGERFVVADVPGLVEGASSGRGLGHLFLRHIVRCRALVFVVDLAGEEPEADLRTLAKELTAYDPDLAARPCLVVGTKADLVEDPDRAVGRLGHEAIAVSGVTGAGVDDLRERLQRLAEQGEQEAPRASHVVLRPGRPRFTISRDDTGRWHVAGRGVERWVAEADLDDEDDAAALGRRLRREGVERALAAKGARHGDEVVIRDRIFEFLPDDPASDHDGERGAAG